MAKKTTPELEELKDALGREEPIAMPEAANVPTTGVPTPPPVGPEGIGGPVGRRAPHAPGEAVVVPGAPVRARNPLFDGPDTAVIAAGRMIGQMRQALAGIASGIEHLGQLHRAAVQNEQFTAACVREGIEAGALAEAVATLEAFLETQKPAQS